MSGVGAVVNQHVVNDLAVAGPDLDRLHPLRFGEVGRDVEVLVLDRAFGRQLVRLGHFEDRVRLAERPALGESGHWRHVLRIPFRRAAVRPLGQGVLLGGGQPALVEERAMRRVRVPRRHCPVGDLVANRLRPGTNLLVREERHRGDLPGTMTGRTVLEEDRGDVAGEGRDASAARAASCASNALLRANTPATHRRVTASVRSRLRRVIYCLSN